MRLPASAHGHCDCAYLNNDDYDLAGSFVIGDRATDVELARNLGCRAIFLQDSTESLRGERT